MPPDVSSNPTLSANLLATFVDWPRGWIPARPAAPLALRERAQIPLHNAKLFTTFVDWPRGWIPARPAAPLAPRERAQIPLQFRLASKADPAH